MKNKFNFNNHLTDYANKWKIKEEDIKKELDYLQNFNFVQDGSVFSQSEFTTNYIQSLNKDHIHKEYNSSDSIQKTPFKLYHLF